MGVTSRVAALAIALAGCFADSTLDACQVPDGDLIADLEAVETTCELDDEPVAIPVGFSGRMDGCDVDTTREDCTTIVDVDCRIGTARQRWRFELVSGPDGVEGIAEVESSAVVGECAGLYRIRTR